MHHLYKITNTLNNKVYIGQSVDGKYRWRQHVYFAKHPEKTGQYIHRAMAKDGTQNFVFEIIATCQTQDDADVLEDQLIVQYDSRNSDRGYNLCHGGGNGWLGKKHTQATKDKISAIKTGTVPSEEARQKASETMKQKCAEGWIQATRFEPGDPRASYWKGRKRPEEESRAKSKRMMGHEVSIETRAKIGAKHKGKVISQEQRRLMSENSKGQRRSPGTEFQKGAVPHNKRVFSDEEVAKIKMLLEQHTGVTEIAHVIGMERHGMKRALVRLGMV